MKVVRRISPSAPSRDHQVMEHLERSAAQRRRGLAPDFEDWFEPAGEDVPLVVRGRGVLGPAVGYSTLFIVGLVTWTLVFSPEAPQATIEAMLGLDGAPHSGHGAHYSGPEGWAASISEEANFSGDAEVLPPPSPGDWLYHFPEQGQTFHQFVAQARNRRSEARNKIYVVQLGHLGHQAQPIVGVTAEFLDVYYDTPTKFLTPLKLPSSAYNTRRGQYDARKVLDNLAENMPEDALGMVAITDKDLFIPSVNYVFGLGSYRQRVAVFSVHRYGGDYRLKGEVGTVMRRSLTVAVHEFGHVMSMRHCTAFRCIMNGTNSLEEADNHPLHLCPVCRQKAEYAIGYHREDRYARVLEFFDRYGFENESEFVRRRLDPPSVEFLDDHGNPL